MYVFRFVVDVILWEVFWLFSKSSMGVDVSWISIIFRENMGTDKLVSSEIQNSTHTWILGTPDFLMATQAYICKTYLYTQASSTSSEFSSSNLLIVSSITKYHGQAKKEFREELELFLIGSKQFDACHARRMRQEGWPITNGSNWTSSSWPATYLPCLSVCSYIWIQNIWWPTDFAIPERSILTPVSEECCCLR